MLDLESFIAELRLKQPRLAIILEKIQLAVNNLGGMVGADPTGHSSPPPSPSGISVASGTDHIHVTLSDNSIRSRALNYFVEWSVNDPSFGNPNVEYLGPSRGKVLALPAKDGGGVAIKYYVRGYSSYLGSDAPSKKVTYGGAPLPTAVQLTGASQLTPLASTGAGTAPTELSSGGQGFGLAQQTPPTRESRLI